MSRTSGEKKLLELQQEVQSLKDELKSVAIELNEAAFGSDEDQRWANKVVYYRAKEAKVDESIKDKEQQLADGTVNVWSKELVSAASGSSLISEPPSAAVLPPDNPKEAKLPQKEVKPSPSSSPERESSTATAFWWTAPKPTGIQLHRQAELNRKTDLLAMLRNLPVRSFLLPNSSAIEPTPLQLHRQRERQSCVDLRSILAEAK